LTETRALTCWVHFEALNLISSAATPCLMLPTYGQEAMIVDPNAEQSRYIWPCAQPPSFERPSS
jgi:hypothetical protein